METKRRTQEERSATTREALKAAARRLWAARGFADVGTPEIAREAGELAAQPLRPLAHVLIGALDEGAMVIADATDRDQARLEVREVLLRLLDGVLVDPG